MQRVIAVNRYDYDAGRGLRRGSFLANVILGLNGVPVLGATVMRPRQFPVEKRIFEGGVVRKQSFPPGLLKEMYRVGGRRGHYRAFMSLVRHWPGWEQARKEYGNIQVPVLLLYGGRDWSRIEERQANARDIPGAQIRTVDGGHFLSLENPAEVTGAVESTLKVGETRGW